MGMNASRATKVVAGDYAEEHDEAGAAFRANPYGTGLGGWIATLLG